ncbi:hypothetical protein [Dactylosporangium sp. NPDC000521]|uniref:hypothetical protein n=1 Tax=Dactylosporangium sp. NPDC000521 TaxID=3363975 RepID=UPI0036C370B1
MPDQTPASYELLVGEWHSTMTDSLHLEGTLLERPMPEVPWPAGWDFPLPGAVRRHRRTVVQRAWEELPQQVTGAMHRQLAARRDLGPYTVTYAKFRLRLHQRHISYVLAVASNQKVPTGRGSSRADARPSQRRHSPGSGAAAVTV